MRKIEQQMVAAIRERKNWKSGNTEVVHSDGGKYFKVYLFGNLIASGKDAGLVTRLDDCGYRTVTTKSRLNAMIDNLPMGIGGIYQRKGDWFYSYGDKTHLWAGSIVASLLPDVSSMDLDF